MSAYSDLAYLGVTVRPFETWPGVETSDRTSSPFTATLSDTLSVLERELRQLGAIRRILRLAIAPAALRVDGLPRASARCEHPGVVLAADTRHGSMSWACDRYLRPSWRSSAPPDWAQNLRAIALGLEALRKVDRYGIGDGTQYRGYAELPAGRPMPATHMTTDDAVRTIAEWARVEPELVEPGGEHLRSQIRAAMANSHPDRAGHADGFHHVQAAKALLEREAGRG